MKCKRDDTAVLVVDYQEKLIPAICNKDTLIPRTRILLEGLRQLGVPIIISEQYPKDWARPCRRSVRRRETPRHMPRRRSAAGTMRSCVRRLTRQDAAIFWFAARKHIFACSRVPLTW